MYICMNIDIHTFHTQMTIGKEISIGLSDAQLAPRKTSPPGADAALNGRPHAWRFHVTFRFVKI